MSKTITSCVIFCLSVYEVFHLELQTIKPQQLPNHLNDWSFVLLCTIQLRDTNNVHKFYRHNQVSIERATSRKSDKSKTVSKEQQEYCQFELKIVFLMTKLTLGLILTLIDPYDA